MVVSSYMLILCVGQVTPKRRELDNRWMDHRPLAVADFTGRVHLHVLCLYLNNLSFPLLQHPVTWQPSKEGDHLLGRITLSKRSATMPKEAGALLGLKVRVEPQKHTYREREK